MIIWFAWDEHSPKCLLSITIPYLISNICCEIIQLWAFILYFLSFALFDNTFESCHAKMDIRGINDSLSVQRKQAPRL